MLTVLEYIWVTDRMTILRLLGLRLLQEAMVVAVIREPLPRVENQELWQYERLMRARAYRRAKGGALRQVRWA